jgi:hypothetical protein
VIGSARHHGEFKALAISSSTIYTKCRKQRLKKANVQATFLLLDQRSDDESSCHGNSAAAYTISAMI